MNVTKIRYLHHINLSLFPGSYFFTPDRADQHHCAPYMRAGWWYYYSNYYCAAANPNGVYYNTGHYNKSAHGMYDGIYWKDWLGVDYGLKFVSMSLYH